MSLWRRKASVDEASEPPLACWFCKKAHTHVRVLIAGPDGVNICEECVHICDEILAKRILEEPENRDSLDIRGGPLVGDPESLQCGLCRMPAPLAGALVLADRGVLCGGCLEAVREMSVNAHA